MLLGRKLKKGDTIGLIAPSGAIRTEGALDRAVAEAERMGYRVKLGESCDVRATLRPILSNAAIMGSDLYEVGLAELVEENFARIITGPGAVRRALHKLMSE